MKYRSNSILAYIPQNKDGERILQQALFFQEALGMRIFLIDIIKSGTFFSPNPKSKKNQIRHKGALNKLNDFVKNALQKEIPHNIILRIGWGKLINTLIRESEQGGYEFTIIDKSECCYKDAPKREDIDKFVSKSHCPVLTINKDHPVEKVEKIIIPIDIIQATKKKLYWATFFAKKFRAKIQIVSALNINIEETKSLAYKNAEKLKKMLHERGVKSDVKLLKVKGQEKHRVILDHIEKEKPELVIIRTHKDYHFTGKKIGKFVSEIIHGCKTPVFTVGGTTMDYNVDLI